MFYTAVSILSSEDTVSLSPLLFLTESLIELSTNSIVPLIVPLFVPFLKVGDIRLVTRP